MGSFRTLIQGPLSLHIIRNWQNDSENKFELKPRNTAKNTDLFSSKNNYQLQRKLKSTNQVIHLTTL
jgi:hypothetical protein